MSSRFWCDLDRSGGQEQALPLAVARAFVRRHRVNLTTVVRRYGETFGNPYSPMCR